MGAGADVEALYRTLLDRWNVRDAAGFAELLTADGSIVGFDGTCVETPPAIADHPQLNGRASTAPRARKRSVR